VKPIFIGGTGRCGTTILKRVLLCHSKIVGLPGELRVLIDHGGALDLIAAMCERWSPYNADIAIQRFRGLMMECGRAKSRATNLLEKVEKKTSWSLGITTRRYLGMGFSQHFGPQYYFERLDELVNTLTYHVSRGSHDASRPYRVRSKIFETRPWERDEISGIVSRFFDDLYRNLSGRDEATYWLDDTPYSLLHAHELLGVFPDMRMIHIYRDPRDVTASYRGFRWGGDSIAAIAQRVAGIYSRWFEIRETLPPNCFLELCLEELAADPISHLLKVCDFIGLEFEDGLTSVSLNGVNSGRWKEDLSIDEVQLVESYLSRPIDAYGYYRTSCG
jgi:hypothetical protein